MFIAYALRAYHTGEDVSAKVRIEAFLRWTITAGMLDYATPRGQLRTQTAEQGESIRRLREDVAGKDAELGRLRRVGFL